MKSALDWFLAQPGFFRTAVGIIVGMVVGTFLVTLISKPAGKPLGKHFFDKWMGLAEILQTIVMSTILGLMFFLVVPFFVLVFMRKDDLLGENLDGDSYWHDSPDLDYSIQRTYRLY